MAEIWPRLKKKLSGDGKRKKKSKAKGNPYAASGLEKFAALLEGIQAKKGSSLVERTASSLSAARSISRSAQEWTASTLARSASRRSAEAKPLQCAAFAALAPKPTPVAATVQNLSEERQPQGRRSHGEVAMASPPEEVSSLLSEVNSLSSEEASASSPVGVRLPERTSRCRAVRKVRNLHQQGSKSAFVVLVALGTFISSRFGKVGKPLAAVLTFSAVIQIWHKGKVSARFMFSSVALYFFTPLRSYLVTRIPARLNVLPRALKTIPSTEDKSQNSEIAVAQEQQDARLGFTLESVEESVPLSIVLPIPESSGIAPLHATAVRKSSTARRLAKKITSRFKKLKLFRPPSSSSASSLSTLSISECSRHSDTIAEPSSPKAPSSHPARPASPDRCRMCPFSRRLHKAKSADVVSDLAQHDDSTSRKCIVIRRQRSSDSVLCKKSKTLSSETLDEYNLSESMPSSASSSLHGKSASLSSTNVYDATNSSSRDDVSWPVVGLLVALLFLLVGRFPAIMATSLFFVVVSNASHDRAHFRGRGRDHRALEAARKLQRSPPPRRF